MSKITLISLEDYEAVIQVGTKKLTAMIALAPYYLDEGKDYDVELRFCMFDKFEIKESNIDGKSILYLENYSYKLIGKLIDILKQLMLVFP